MVKRKRAAVVPRVLSEISGDAFAIEEVLEPFLGRAGAIALLGPPGAGKTTALEHLGAVLRGRVVIFDEAAVQHDVWEAAKSGLAVYGCARAYPMRHIAKLKLAPWGRDEAMEYLMAAHPDRCADVMARLALEEDLGMLEGSPELWRLALDGMAKRSGTLVAALGEIATRAAPTDRILEHRVLRRLRQAHAVVSEIRPGGECGALRTRMPRDVVCEVARLLGDSARPKGVLSGLCEGPPDDRQPMAATLLLAMDPDWRPVGAPRLDGAYLGGARWSGIELGAAFLPEADLRDADLSGAALAGSVLAKADLRGTRLAGADLAGAMLQDATIEGADFSGANLSGAQCALLDLRTVGIEGANFSAAHLEGCHLEGVRLAGARFDHANLEGAHLTASVMPGACFRDAKLRDVKVADVHWEGANLRGADLRGAIFHMGSSRSGLVDSVIASEGSRTGFYTDESEDQHFRAPEEIRKANLRGADLRGAHVLGTDFYLVDLREARYTAAQASHFRRCRAILGAGPGRPRPRAR